MKIERRQWFKPTWKAESKDDRFLEIKDGEAQGELEPEWAKDTVVMRLPDGKAGAPIPTSNWLTHSDFVGPLIEKLRPLICVELGVWNGCSFLVMRAWAKYYKVNCQFFGFDVWLYVPQEGDTSPPDGELIYQTLVRRTRAYGNVHLYRLESAEGASLIPMASVDLLHIDATHTQTEVRRDLALWLPKVAANGVVLLHDVGMITPEHEVWRVWREIQRDYPTYTDTRACGLGAFCPRGVPPALSHLFRRAVVV